MGGLVVGWVDGWMMDEQMSCVWVDEWVVDGWVDRYMDG